MLLRQNGHLVEVRVPWQIEHHALAHLQGSSEEADDVRHLSATSE